MKKVMKIGGRVLLTLVAMVLLLAGLTQTQFFRDRLRSFALDRLGEVLDAEIQIGEIHGNLITGFSIEQISLKVDSDFLLAADRLILAYNPFELPGKVISIDEIRLVRPTLKLLRSPDGGWNFNRMIRPTPEDTTAASPFDWTVLLKRVVFQEGVIELVDSAALVDPEHDAPDTYHVEYHDLQLTAFNLASSIEIRPDEKRVRISSLTFHSERPEVSVDEFSGDFLVTPTAAYVRDLVIKTGRSNLNLNASMKNFDLLGGIDLFELKRNPVNVSLRGQDIDLDELKRFLPQLDFLAGRVTVALDAEGEFGELMVKSLEVTRGQTEFHITGGVYSLHQPRDLYLDVKITESRLFAPDARSLMPSFNLPEFAALGVTTLNLEYDGKPRDFHTKFYLETAGGNVHADAAMKIGGPQRLTYKGEFLGQHVDFGRIFARKDLESRWNGTIKIEGEGVSPDDLAATLQVHADTSSILGRPMAPSELVLDVRNRAASGRVTASLGTASADIAGEWNWKNKNTPAFTVNGHVSSFNLKDIFPENSLTTDLTLGFNASGSGGSLDRLTGDFNLSFEQSRINDYVIPEGVVHLNLDQQNGNQQRLTLESPIADLSLAGRFDLDYLQKLLAFETGSLRKAVGEKFSSLDSSLVRSVDTAELEKERRVLAGKPVRLDVEYSVQLKNLEPVTILTGNRTFDGTGLFTGTIAGDVQSLDFHLQLALDDLVYGNVESGILLRRANAVLDVKKLEPRDPLKNLAFQFDIDALRMHLDREEFDSLRGTFRYGGEQFFYNAETRFNGDWRYAVTGDAGVSPDRVAFALKDLLVEYKGYSWMAHGATGSIDAHSFRVDELVFKRDSQRVAISGIMGKGGSISGHVVGTGIDLTGTEVFLSEEELGARRKAFAGSCGFDIELTGTMEKPRIQCALRTSQVSYRAIPIGNLDGHLSYEDEILRTQVEMHKGGEGPSSQTVLTINGSIPLNLGFAGVEERLPDKPMDLTVKSTGIQMSVLDPLLPTFNELTGILACDVQLVGSPRRPQYQGLLSIDSCAFLFVPNNIYYTFDGWFKPEGERIKVINATVRNVAADKRFGKIGQMNITGDLALREFKPSDFNLTAKGDLLVVKESTGKSSLAVSGNLFVEMGADGLLYTGTIEHSVLSGTIVVGNSTLVFPPTQAAVAKESELSIPVIVVNDTVKEGSGVSGTLRDRYFGIGPEGNKQRVADAGDEANRKSFLDGVRYDLTLEATGGNTEIRMVFFPATGEELVANVEGRVSITEDGKRWIGDMTVENAYYNFYKRFDAEGRLRFTGDLMNPELEIKASYQGTRTIQDSVSDRTENVVVNLKITGTRKEPKLDISMTIDDVDYYSYTGPTSSDVQNDALAFIITGSFALTQSQKNEVATNIGSAVGSSLLTGATSLFSSNLSEFLRRETGFINSIEFRYGSQGSFGESADIRVSGVAAGGLWKYGGKILNDPFSNANVSILYSVGNIFSKPSLRNFMVELERRIETTPIGQTSDRKEINSARLFYRISF